MKNALIRHICRMLIICMGAFSFSTYAGMIGTDQIAAAQAVGARDKVRDFMARGEVANRLQGLGVSPAAAQARVNAMTDAEVASIAGRIDKLPAGGISFWAVGAGLIVVELIWYFWVR
ncbi:MAG: PA2779 family protein [Burkholderiales bacterium]